ncbi:22529_t:CDS:1 [Gigaspora margarita]|uniref:22529_t:CDS:1 n=1 Tax=Gigaspora margarita TaxID=4874 RepID=A0ABN7WGJ4_GIGMA|nr:22529_t:CDS:1 [Gigaspora margarita]
MLKEKISQARLYEDLKEDEKIFNMIKDMEFKDKILKNKIENLRLGKINELKKLRQKKEEYFTREINNSKNIHELDDDDESRFTKEIFECDLFTESLKKKYNKIKEFRYSLILKYQSILDQIKKENDVKYFEDGAKFDRVITKINNKELEIDLQTKRKLN